MKDKANTIVGFLAVIGIFSIILFVSNIFSKDEEPVCEDYEQQIADLEQEKLELENDVDQLENENMSLTDYIDTLKEEIADLEDDCGFETYSARIEKDKE